MYKIYLQGGIAVDELSTLYLQQIEFHLVGVNQQLHLKQGKNKTRLIYVPRGFS